MGTRDLAFGAATGCHHQNYSRSLKKKKTLCTEVSKKISSYRLFSADNCTQSLQLFLTQVLVIATPEINTSMHKTGIKIMLSY